MKKTMRILVLLLAAALLLPMLLACVEQNNPPESTAPATTEPDETVIQKQTVYNYTTLTESPEEGIISDFRDILTGSGMTVNWMPPMNRASRPITRDMKKRELSTVQVLLTILPSNV